VALGSGPGQVVRRTGRSASSSHQNGLVGTRRRRVRDMGGWFVRVDPSARSVPAMPESANRSARGAYLGAQRRAADCPPCHVHGGFPELDAALAPVRARGFAQGCIKRIQLPSNDGSIHCFSRIVLVVVLVLAIGLFARVFDYDYDDVAPRSPGAGEARRPKPSSGTQWVVNSHPERLATPGSEFCGVASDGGPKRKQRVLKLCNRAPKVIWSLRPSLSS
jgi:hypothetical protein